MTLLLSLAAAAAVYRTNAMQSAANEGENPPSQPNGVQLIRAQPPETGAAGPTAWSGKPEAVKAVYVSGYVAGSPMLEEYIRLAETTEINALVIDVKDVTGELMYDSDVQLAQQIGANTGYISDLEGMVENLESRGIYTIARLPVFEDDLLPRQRPDLAVTDTATGSPWVNFSNVAWANPHSREVWKYNAAIAREVAEAGFDEIQFDYVRFPSDGPMARVDYGEEIYPTPEDTIAAFLEYASKELRPLGVTVAADVFGLAAGENGAGIGQIIPKLAPHVDVLCPMVYPSHYPAGSYGYSDPNTEPYNIVANSMAEFEEQTASANPDLEIRPWLQDFDLGEPDYGPAELRSQIQATYDAGETGWLLWNPANEYTGEALLPE